MDMAALFRIALNIETPWFVKGVKFNESQKILEIKLDLSKVNPAF